MKAQVKNEVHILSCEADCEGALQVGAIIQQLQQIVQQENMKNRMAIKALLCCTHFLTRHHISYMTKFDQIVDLIVSCGAEDLKKFHERTGKVPATRPK